MNKIIIITTPSFGKYEKEPWKRLENHGFQLLPDYGLKSYKLLPEKEKEAVVGLIVGLEIIDREVMDAFPNLGIIAKHGAGIDNIDLSTADKKKIRVVRAPGANARAVAELALGLMIAISRSIPLADRNVRRGSWKRLFGSELKNKTLSIIGCGAIGRELALMAAGIGMNVLAYDVVHDPEAKANFVDLETALKEGDYISLHTPLIESTKHLINSDTLKIIKDTAFVINTARGGLIDDVALIQALQNGDIAGAALDAFESEPIVNEKFIEMDNVILTSHIGGFSVEAINRTAEITAQHILDWVN